jgi:hypothetical protein
MNTNVKPDIKKLKKKKKIPVSWTYCDEVPEQNPDAYWNVDFVFRFGSKNAWFIYGIMVLL